MSCTSCNEADKLYVGNYGVSIVVETCSSVSTATTLRMEVQKPDGTSVQWSATALSGDTEETKIYYVLTSGDIDQAGEYFLQAYIADGTSVKRGNKTSFVVHPLFS